jgi:hypothetical protein
MAMTDFSRPSGPFFDNYNGQTYGFRVTLTGQHFNDGTIDRGSLHVTVEPCEILRTPGIGEVMKGDLTFLELW